MRMKKLRLASVFAVLTVILLSSCSDDNKTLDSSPITMKCGSSIELKNRGDVTVDNIFVADVDESGTTLTANHVGKTRGIMNQTTPFDITVERSINYIEDPCTDWGTTNAPAPKIDGYKSVKIDNGNPNAVLYFMLNSKDKVNYMYGYNYGEGKLYGAILFVPFSEVETIVDWLGEKYFLMLTNNDKIFSTGFDAYDEERATTLLGITSQVFSSSSNAGYQLTSRLWYAIVFLDVHHKTKAIDTNSIDIQNILDQCGIEAE